MIVFVIERTWQKPRDIIRLMSCLHNIISANAYYYEAEDFAEAMSEIQAKAKDGYHTDAWRRTCPRKRATSRTACVFSSRKMMC